MLFHSEVKPARYVIATVTETKCSQVNGYGTKMTPAYGIFFAALESI